MLGLRQITKNRKLFTRQPVFQLRTVFEAPKVPTLEYYNYAQTTTTTKSYFSLVALAAAALLAMLWGQEAEAATVPSHGLPGTVQERTFIAVCSCDRDCSVSLTVKIKPDGVQRNLVGEIIKRFEARGYKLVAIKMVTPTQAFAAEHYDDLKTKPFFKSLTAFFSSGPVVAMVWEGPGVIKGGRNLLGATRPEESLPGTIRGDLCIIVDRNICHGSDSPDAAEHEIGHWFKPEEINNWQSANKAWVLGDAK